MVLMRQSSSDSRGQGRAFLAHLISMHVGPSMDCISLRLPLLSCFRSHALASIFDFLTRSAGPPSQASSPALGQWKPLFYVACGIEEWNGRCLPSNTRRLWMLGKMAFPSWVMQFSKEKFKQVVCNSVGQRSSTQALYTVKFTLITAYCVRAVSPTTLSVKWTSYYILLSGCHKCNSLWPVSLRSECYTYIA
jgi:hypothetical protein